MKGGYGEFIAHYELFEHPFVKKQKEKKNIWLTSECAIMLLSLYF